jgi:hypothetical protein
MGTRWFEDPAEGERLGDPLVRLTGAVSRMLDGLGSPAVAPGTGRGERLAGPPGGPGAVRRVPPRARRHRPGGGLAGAGAATPGGHPVARLRAGPPTAVGGHGRRRRRAGRPPALAPRLGRCRRRRGGAGPGAGVVAAGGGGRRRRGALAAGRPHPRAARRRPGLASSRWWPAWPGRPTRPLACGGWPGSSRPARTMRCCSGRVCCCRLRGWPRPGWPSCWCSWSPTGARRWPGRRQRPGWPARSCWCSPGRSASSW